jgi:hypothetical protein
MAGYRSNEEYVPYTPIAISLELISQLREDYCHSSQKDCFDNLITTI